MSEEGEQTAGADAMPETVIFVVNGRERPVDYRPGETLLEAAQRQGLRLPFSCQIGSCATCVARVGEGRVEMISNNVLTDDEVDQGWVLVCQGVPFGAKVTISYD